MVAHSPSCDRNFVKGRRGQKQNPGKHMNERSEILSHPTIPHTFFLWESVRNGFYSPLMAFNAPSKRV
jgi:hypothetical protein